MSSSSTPPFELGKLLGISPSSEDLTAHISALCTKISNPGAAIPDVKSYSDAVYFNYFPLGLSLLFKPINGYRPKTGLKREELKDGDLVLDGIDIYNIPKPSSNANVTSNKSKQTYSTYPLTPIALPLSSDHKLPDGKPRLAQFSVKPDTTGKEFVQDMGEPDRKGGGAGPSSGSIGIWCEWSKDGVMVEFGGDESRGPQAWERGKDAIWKIISIFPPKTT